MTAIKYDIGDNIRLSVTLTNVSGTLADPTTVTCTTEAPNGVTAAQIVTKDSTGLYHADVAPDQSGEWSYRWAGVGALIVAEEGTFYVRERRVG